MTNVVAADTLGLVSTYAERLRWCVDNRAPSMRDLSLKAGLSGGGIQKLIERNSTRVDPDEVKLIAEAAGVSFLWLLLGWGSPDSDDSTRAPSVPDSDRPELRNIPGFAEAVELARSEPANASVPDWAWEAAAEMRPKEVPVITTASVADLARWNLHHLGTGQRAVQARARHAVANAELAQQADDVAEGRAPMPTPSPEEKPRKGKGRRARG